MRNFLNNTLLNGDTGNGSSCSSAETTKPFNKCLQWKFESSEFSCFNNGTCITAENCQTFGPHDYALINNSSLFVCVPDSVSTYWVPYVDAYFVGLWILCAGFLVVTVIRMRHCVFRYREAFPLMCHMLSVIMTCFALIAFQLTPTSNIVMLHVESFINEFSIFSTFTWLHLIYFDLIRQFHPQWIFQNRSLERLTVFCQLLYGWIFPFVFVLVVTLLDIYQFSKPMVRMRYGMYSSTLHQTISYVSIAVLTVGNVVLYLVTAFTLKRVGNSVAAVNPRSKDKMELLSMRLFILMGVLVVLTLVGTILPVEKWIYAIVTDTIVGLQGIFLSIIYGSRLEL